LMAAEHDLLVDKEGFNQLMENDRKVAEAAESARKGGSNKDLSMEAEQTAFLISQNLSPTENADKYIWNTSPKSEIQALYRGRGGEDAGFCEEIGTIDGLVGIVLGSSPFYYESGGQTYDTGKLISEDGSVEFMVTNVQAYGGFIVHVGFLVNGTLSLRQTVSCVVDYERRSYIAPNHTMTHILNYALKSTLIAADDPNPEKYQGQCEQKGSLVDSERLRFDFSWSGPLSIENLTVVESKVNDFIQQNRVVYSEVVPLSEAKEIQGLRQVFGEKYPDPVRVISVEVSISTLLSDPTNSSWKDTSIEFCGGTHLNYTSEAEDFVLMEESGIAKGIRRIIGVTRREAQVARDRAKELSSKISKIETLAVGPELSEAVKGIKIEVRS